MKKCLLMILIAFVGFLGIGMVRGLLEKTEINESTIRERHVISYIQNASGYAGDIAATKDAVFVAYNEKMAAIEAYNYRGVYQYTILLADAQNGGIRLWSDGDILYVSSKYGNVFAFQGQQLLWKMDFGEAREQGIDNYFSRPSNVSVNGDTVLVMNEKNQIAAKVPLPIRTTMQIHGEKIMLYVMLVVVIISAVVPILKDRITNRRTL